jgi:hypothetical protein
MAHKIGSNDVAKYYVGSSEVDKIYLGTVEIYSKGPAYVMTGIYGVSGVGQSSPTLTRTDDAVGKVANSGVGSTPVQNDFDLIYPWGGMQQETDENGNVFVFIPKHYCLITDSSGIRTIKISMVKQNASWFCPACFIKEDGVTETNGIYVGAYLASVNGTFAESKSGKTPIGNIIRADWRTYCSNVSLTGFVHHQLDLATWSMLQNLFTIEFAATNSQSIMYGYCNANSSVKATGGTNGVVASSGSPSSNTTGKYQMKYRGIEDMWGNLFQICDGLNSVYQYVGGNYNHNMYVCKKPSLYSDDNTNYNYVYTYTSGYPTFVKTLYYSSSYLWCNLPKTVAGSNATYLCDQFQHNDNANGYYVVGSDYRLALAYGLWGMLFATASDGYSGCRLIKRPI